MVLEIVSSSLFMYVRVNAWIHCYCPSNWILMTKLIIHVLYRWYNIMGNLVSIEMFHQSYVCVLLWIEDVFGTEVFGIYADFTKGPYVFEEIKELLTGFEIGVLGIYACTSMLLLFCVCVCVCARARVRAWVGVYLYLYLHPTYIRYSPLVSTWKPI